MLAYPKHRKQCIKIELRCVEDLIGHMRRETLPYATVSMDFLA
jgi:hypothetical protein